MSGMSSSQESSAPRQHEADKFGSMLIRVKVAVLRALIISNITRIPHISEQFREEKSFLVLESTVLLTRRNTAKDMPHPTVARTNMRLQFIGELCPKSIAASGDIYRAIQKGQMPAFEEKLQVYLTLSSCPL
jgi:hypothetical protein